MFYKKQELKEVRKMLNEIPYLNAGGCGIAALAMATWYKKNVDDSYVPEFKYLYTISSSTQQHNESILYGDSISKPDAASHIMVTINGVDYDSTPKGLKMPYVCGEHIADEEFLRASIKYGGWNHLFCKDLFVPFIEDQLGIELNL